MIGRGQTFLLTGHCKEAKNIFEGIIAKNDKIMAAYDFLSQTLLKMNDPQEAQAVLIKAIGISPRAILRQKNLGNIAYRNEDYAIAETAYEFTIELGEYSCFKSFSDYINLAKTMVQLNNPEKGLTVLQNDLKAFPKDSEARLRVDIAESYVYKKMNKDSAAHQAITRAQEIMKEKSCNITPDIKLELAKAYIITGKNEKGMEIIKNLVQEHHDDNKMLDNLHIIFRETGMEDQGQRIIEETKKEIIDLNNEGVQLVQNGKLPEAITLFEKAVSRLPENKIINANAAQVIMLFMKEKGISENNLTNAKTYLDRLRKIDEKYPDIPMLEVMNNELACDRQR